MRKRYRLFATLSLAMAASTVRAGVGAWTTNGPTGGAAFVGVDPGNPSLLYTESARSTDGGLTWGTNNLIFNFYDAFAVGPSRTVYVAAHNLDENLYVSHDAAVNWEAIYTLPSQPYAFMALGGLVVDPASASTLYVNAASTTWPYGFVRFEKSVDGGRNWTGVAPYRTDRTYVVSVALDPVTSGTLYVSVAGYFCCYASYKTTDGAQTWTPMPTPGNEVLALDSQHPSTLYAAGRIDARLWKSADGGTTFAPIASNLPAVNQLLVWPTRSSRLVALNGQTVLVSEDGGATFEPIPGSPTGVTMAAVGPSGDVLYAATPSGVYAYQFDPGVLTLNAAHPFTVTLTATDQRTDRTGAGVATQVNDLWGYFSLPAITGNPSNPEVFVKMLDGTAINGMYWFFYGGLTDLEYTLTVKEDATGLTRTYTKAAGSECGGSDTAAFGP